MCSQHSQYLYILCNANSDGSRYVCARTHALGGWCGRLAVVAGGVAQWGRTQRVSGERGRWLAAVSWPFSFQISVTKKGQPWANRPRSCGEGWMSRWCVKIHYVREGDSVAVYAHVSLRVQYLRLNMPVLPTSAHCSPTGFAVLQYKSNRIVHSNVRQFESVCLLTSSDCATFMLGLI